MSEINKENLSPEVAAYIAALENKVEKLQSTVENLNEMLVKEIKYSSAHQAKKQIISTDQHSFAFLTRLNLNTIKHLRNLQRLLSK